MKSVAAALLAVAIPCTAADAQGWDDGPPRDHAIVPEDYFGLAYVDTAVISPDGSRIAYVERRWEPERDGRNADLWVVEVATKQRTRLTFDPASDGAPVWSPDGTWIYFTSDRAVAEGDEKDAPGGKQVWRVRPDIGQVAAVTREPDGIGTFRLARDGQTLYFTTRTGRPADDRWAKLRKRFDKLAYGDGPKRRDLLHEIDLESWHRRTLVDEGRVIRAFAVGPEGRRIAMITAPDEQLISYEGWSEVDVWQREDGVVRRLPDRLWRDDAPSPYGWIVEPCWADDGGAVAFAVAFDGYPAEVFVAELEDGSAPRIWRVDRPDEVHVGGAVRWRPGSRDLCFLADWRARRRVYVVHDLREGRQGEAFPLTPWDVVVNDFSFGARAEDVAVVMGGLDHPPDVFTLTEPGPDTLYERVTELNPQVDRWQLPRIEVCRWTSPDGTEVEGVLELPHDYRGEKPLPMVVHLHGGPTSASRHVMQFGIGGRTLFAARGWALFSPNYRGSTGYGDRFMTDLIGHKNDRDVADILSGVDALVARGIADPDRLAVMGWSNGGFLTNCLITRTDRFKAASSGAGVFDTAMQWSLEDTPGHVMNFQQGSPWRRPEAMMDASALYAVDRVRTPTLIHVGENDERVPAAHSRALYRALHRYLGVSAELVVYPGAGHGLTTRGHRRAKLTWDLAWFDYHVLGIDSPAP
jgi:dipeptidyl aminopeptidase/acylaminoacyl peptidase